MSPSSVPRRTGRRNEHSTYRVKSSLLTRPFTRGGNDHVGSEKDTVTTQAAIMGGYLPMRRGRTILRLGFFVMLVGVLVIVVGFLGLAYFPVKPSEPVRPMVPPGCTYCYDQPRAPLPAPSPFVPVFFSGWGVLAVGSVLGVVGFWRQRKERRRTGLPS
jgi:hypothetical protein